MSTVEEVESAIAKMSPQELRQLSEWLENFLEDRMEILPEFLESIRRGEAGLASGRVGVVRPQAPGF